MTLCIFDFETTGFTANHAVELAALVRCPNGDEYTWYSRMKPSSPIEDGAAAVHGISDLDVANEPADTEKVAEWWNDVLSLHNPEEGPLILAGHNNSFDIRVARKYVDIPRNTLTLCSMRLGRLFSPKSPNHKLTVLHDYLGCSGAYRAHGAMDDVYMADNIIQHYVKETGLTALELAKQQARPIKLDIMPFGKHANASFAVIPSDYMRYMLTMSDVDQDVQYSFRLELERRANA